MGSALTRFISHPIVSLVSLAGHGETATCELTAHPYILQPARVLTVPVIITWRPTSGAGNP